MGKFNVIVNIYVYILRELYMRIFVLLIVYVFVFLNEDLIMESNYIFCIFENFFCK